MLSKFNELIQMVKWSGWMLQGRIRISSTQVSCLYLRHSIFIFQWFMLQVLKKSEIILLRSFMSLWLKLWSNIDLSFHSAEYSMSQQLIYPAPTPQPTTQPANTHTHTTLVFMRTIHQIPVDVDVGAETISRAAHEDSAWHTICPFRTGAGRYHVF